MVESSTKVAPWRAMVTTAAATAAAATGWDPGDRTTAYRLSVVFTVARPTSHYRTGRHAHLLRDTAPAHPTTRPDLDKLLRSTLDALTDSGVIHDDAQVVHVAMAKAYPGGHLDALDTSGAVLLIRGV
jgi:crossover junction endodeoxyribonuclease RusA